MDKDAIRNKTRVEISVLCMIIGAVVWLMGHILPTEAKVESNVKRIDVMEAKINSIQDDTQYIRGKIDQMDHRK